MLHYKYLYMITWSALKCNTFKVIQYMTEKMTEFTFYLNVIKQVSSTFRKPIYC